MAVKRHWLLFSLALLAISTPQQPMAAPLNVPSVPDSGPVVADDVPSGLKQRPLQSVSTKTMLTLIPTQPPKPEDIKGTLLGRGYRVAQGQAVALSSLAWSLMDDGRLVAATDIEVPGAKGLRLALSPSTLPPGVELYLRPGTLNTGESFGPYTRERIHSEGLGLFPPGGVGPYWLPIIDEATIRLELIALDHANIQDTALEFTNVTVFDEPFDTALNKALRRADSLASSCMIDISCADTPISPAVAFATQTRSNGWAYYLPECTGTLLNDTGGTGEPWLLTSARCFSTDFRANNSTVFSWFKRADSCGGEHIDARLTHTYGATRLVSDAEKDVALLHLSQTPPTTARVGWTTTAQLAGQSVFSITQDRNINGDYNQTISFGSIGSVGSSSYSVYWSKGVPRSTPEDASSGAALFNGSDQVVGLLTTPGVNASCEAPHLADEYLRFDHIYPLLEPWLLTDAWNETRLPAGSMVTFSGQVTDFGHWSGSPPSPHCAMVLINGAFDFSCDGDGRYEITAPLDASGKATVMVFAQGHLPYRRVLFPPATKTSFDVALVGREGGKTPRLSRLGLIKAPETATEWVHFGGQVVNDGGEPLCALALANGQHTFTCDSAGEFELTVPQDENGNINLFLFADGLRPYIYTFPARGTWPPH